MQSFVFESQPNKNNSAQKSTTQPPPVNVNPFFQYVTNNRPLTVFPPQKDKPQSNVPFENASNLIANNNERKNSDTPLDPRKMLISNKQPLLQQNSNEQKKLNLETTARIQDLRQKRSRSRQRKISNNRQNSEDSSKTEKKDQHFHKTKLCPLFQKGECKKGAQCHFAHGFKQLRGLPNFFKTRLCLSFDKGQCKKASSDCKYAHGQKELRSLRHDAGYSNTVQNLNKDGKSNRNNDGKGKNNQERRNNQDDRRKNYSQRNNHESNNHKNRKDRDSESINRKDRNRKDSNHRQDSKDRRKNQKINENPLSYKKNIPLNKQYEKFLYGDSNPKAPQVSNSMYMVPNTALYPSVSSNYSQDIYLLNQRKSIETANLNPLSPMNQQKNYPSNERDYNKLYSYGQQPSSLPYYEQNNLVQNKTNFNYPKQKEGLYQRDLYPEVTYPSPLNNQNYTRQQYPSFYQAPSEFVSDFSKDPYKNVNKSAFIDQPYLNESRNVPLKDNRFPESSGYSQVQRNMSSGLPVNQFAGKQQPFYKNDSYYAVPSKTPDNSFLKQSGANSYQSNYPSNGVYDLYPALDNTVNQPQKYPYPYEKSRYSGFSNNMPK